MNNILKLINKEIYTPCALKIANLEIEAESKAYDACSFKLNDLKVISRSAKTTPKKTGQFVTFWTREAKSPIKPFDENDSFNFFVVNTKTELRLGQFVFPKSVLIKKGIISTTKKEGKRALRVYPIWDVTKSKQAIKTQQWQLDYFYEINSLTDWEKVIKLYKNK